MRELLFGNRNQAAKVDEALQSQVEALVRTNAVAELGEMLRCSPQPQARRRAMGGLLQIATREAFDTLAEAAAGPDLGFNDEILEQLRNHPSEDALRSLGIAMTSEDPMRRARAVSRVASRREPAALPLLLRGARDPVRSVCRIAENSLISRVKAEPAQLAKLPRESIAGIIGFLPFEIVRDFVAPDYPSELRQEAARQIGRVGGEDGLATLVALTEETDAALARAAWDGMRAIGRLPATFLLPFLGHSKEMSRKQGIELFASCCGVDGAPLVAAALSDRSALVRETATRALYQLQKEDAIPKIRRLARDADDKVRAAVLAVFSRSPSTTDDLIMFALQEAGAIRQGALIALAQRLAFKPELAELYLSFLEYHSSQPTVPDNVVDAMANIAKILGDANEERAIRGFAALCRTSSRRLRRTGIEALLCFSPEARREILIGLADTHDRSMLAALALALGEAKEPRAILPLIRTYTECGGRPARRAGELLEGDPRLTDVDFLIDGLSNRWASVRKYCAERLKTITDPRVVDPLLQASNDDDVEVQLAAIEALSGFAKEHERVAERLIDACGQGDITVRQASIDALGVAQVEASVPNIIKALYNVFLRPRAEEALKRIGGRQGYLAMKRLQRREILFGKKNKRKPQRRRMPD